MAIKDKKHWSHQSEAAKDEVRDAIADALDWLIARRQQAAWALGGGLAAVLLLGLFLYSRRAANNAAWDKLSQAEIYAYSGRPQEAQKLLEEVAAGSSQAAAAMARLMEGDMHFPRGEFDKALAAYDKAAAESPDALRPFALASKAQTLEAAGKHAECAAAAQSFVNEHGDHLLVPHVLAALARCQQASGQAEAAKSSLQKLALQYAQTSWADWANSRLQTPAR